VVVLKKFFVLLTAVFVVLLAFNAAYARDAGKVTLRTPRTLPSLDWEQTTMTDHMKVWHQMFEGLYGMDEANNGYYNELAKDVKISDNQLTYTIKLVEGVTFQNGEPLKASDVVFSYNRARKNSRFNYLTSMIKDVKAIDDGTVEIELNEPYSPIAHTFFCIKISSEKEITSQGNKYGSVPHKAGTGPYYVTEYDVASGVKLAAYDGYWRGAPAIKNVDYVVIEEASSAVIAFKNNELDYFDNVPLSDWEFLQEGTGGHNKLIKGNNILFMGINYLSPVNDNILANAKLREAIFYAVNRGDINIAVSDGKGVEANQYMPGDYVPTSPSPSEYETYDYNVAKAKTLLAEAGFPDGVDVGTITTYGAPTGYNAITAQVIQANLSEIGITAQVEVAEAAVITPRLYAQDYNICVFSDFGNFDFNNIRQQVHSESTGMYVVRFKDDKSPFNWKRIEELVDLGVSTSDIQKRLGYYTELWKIVMDTATILPVHHMPVGVVWAADLEIGDPVPTYYKVRNFKWK
jgi:peptide/nickel transport system substrate-binding protein